MYSVINERKKRSFSLTLHDDDNSRPQKKEAHPVTAEEKDPRGDSKSIDLIHTERERTRLLVNKETLHCATDYGCIPCTYKLFPRGFDGCPSNQRYYIAIDIEFPKLMIDHQNRPEMCIRAKQLNPSMSSSVGLYRIGQRILTVGDGDFTFSSCLASYLRRKDIPEDSKASIIATSYETKESVLKTYPTSSSTLANIEASGALVLHGIDARNLPEHAALNGKVFDVIVWNFPCKGVPAGLDGQVDEIEENRDMLRSFFSSCGEVINPASGEVHITHKTLEPFSWWKLAEIAESCGWRHEASIIFDKYIYPGYKNCKALDKKSFPTSDALVRFYFVPHDFFITIFYTTLHLPDLYIPAINFRR
jgi:25S rRNA (uracil2634-N3)-methyltransferase